MKTFENTGCMLVVVLIGVLACGAFAVEKPTSDQKTCVTEQCHADYSKKAYVYGPVSLGDCKSCHKPLDTKDHTWQFVRKGKDLCEYCHLDQTSKKNVHEPLSKGDCMQCHEPHSSDNVALLRKQTVAELCLDCHKVAQGAKFLHGPVAVGECTMCHSPHSSDHENLMAVEPSQLCVSCHIITKDEISKFEFIHEPVKGDCVGCHDAHGADNSGLLKAKTPEMCFGCHEEIQNLAETAKVKHNIILKEDGCFRCHTPHASTVKFLLKSNPKKLCVTCHDKPIRINKDKVLPSFAKEIEGKKFMHGPVAQKDCSGCHVTHGSDYFRLLTKEYPPLFYASFTEENYELCFSCHAKTLVLTEKTSDLTDFRNGNLNLHYLHVNKDYRGRTCRSCHSTHASNLPKHIRKSVPYGMWDLPVGFTKTVTGGSCKSGCHLPKVYDRKTPVNYSAPPQIIQDKPKEKDELAKGTDSESI